MLLNKVLFIGGPCNHLYIEHEITEALRITYIDSLESTKLKTVNYFGMPLRVGGTILHLYVMLGTQESDIMDKVINALKQVIITPRKLT